MAKELRFTPKLFDFLRDLKANNKKEWFDPNKQRYLDDVREPMLAFIAAMNPHLRELSSHLVADPKRSMFRIYRDTRFSKNKTPYKTVASCFFYHDGAEKDGPGIYLHLEPGNCFLGVGAWRPDPVTRTKITDAIARNPEAWGAATTAKEFRKVWRLDGESMARLPKQYDPAHPFAVDLTRKDFIVIAKLTDKQVCGTDFLERVDRMVHQTGPFLGFIIQSIGLKW